jgi:hypothetical protein
VCAQEQDFITDKSVGLEIELEKMILAVQSQLGTEVDLSFEQFELVNLEALKNLSMSLDKSWKAFPLFINIWLFQRGIEVFKQRIAEIYDVLHAIFKIHKVKVKDVDEELLMKTCRMLRAMHCKNLADEFVEALPEWLFHRIQTFVAACVLDWERYSKKMESFYRKSFRSFASGGSD